jgi:heme/copper-type cytochrome/quinol oxidase subunit 2
MENFLAKFETKSQKHTIHHESKIKLFLSSNYIHIHFIILIPTFKTTATYLYMV